MGSAGVLSREWGAKLYCEPADCRGTQLLPLKESDSGYAEGGVLTLDELRFTVWHTPGHTEGGVVLLCGEYLFAGDTVFQGSIGRTDLEGGDSRKMDESLRKFDTVYPAAGNGHTAVKLTLQELEAAAGAEGWVDVCKEPEGE